MSRVWLALAALVLAARALAAAPVDADEILRRAEDVRSPDRSYAAEFSIHVVPGGERGVERSARYSMIVNGKDETLVMIRTPDMLYGGLLLMARDDYWMLLPKGSRPLQLAEAQVLQGDISYGDVARFNLASGFTPALSGEEVLDGEPCYRLELTRTRVAAHFEKIVYWVAKKHFFPKKLAYYGRTGSLLKTVSYEDYRKGRLGLHAMRLEVASGGPRADHSTLVFEDLRPLDLARVSFTPIGMAPIRDRALELASNGKQPSMEDVLRASP